MTQQKKGFIFYKSFHEAIKELPNKQQLELYQAIFEYSFEEKEKKLEGISKTIFTLIKPQLEANHKKFLNGCKGAEHGNKGAEHGKKGGRPRNENPPENPPSDEAKNPPENPRKDKVKDKDKDKDKKTKTKKYNDFHFSIASELGKFVKNHYKKNLTMGNIKKWADDIRLLQEEDLSPRENSEEDIKKAMKSIIENTGKPYFVTVQSGTAFRKKFISIEEYSKRENKQSKPPININTNDYDYGTSGKF